MSLERQKYVTQMAHGLYPVGTECWASRESDTAPLVLEFDDGIKLELGSSFYAGALEPLQPRAYAASSEFKLAV